MRTFSTGRNLTRQTAKMLELADNIHRIIDDPGALGLL